MHVTDNSHHEYKEFYGIVGDCELSTPRQDNSRIFQYEIYEIKDNQVVDDCAWYDENDLTALDKQDRDKAEDMIQEFEMKG